MNSRVICVALLVIGLGFAGRPTVLEGQQRTLTLEEFDAVITVRDDATLEVVEHLRFRFDGRWNGIFRSIPVELEDSRGFRTRVVLDIAGVVDGAGTPLEYEVSREGRNRVVKVWVPDAADRTETVTLRYEARRALRFFETHDELYWNVTGNDWEVPIRHAVARVILPDGTTGRRVAAYTGAWGSRENDATIAETADGYRFEVSDLAFREGMTVVIGWDSGVIARPTTLDRVGWFLADNWPLFLPLLTLVFMWRRWLARGKDPEALPITPRYEPPEGLTPGTAGTLVDNAVDMRDITATLIDLAIRGHLRIEEKPQSRLRRMLSRPEYRFVREDAAPDPVQEYEARLLRGIFGTGTVVETSDLEDRFYKHLSAIREAVFARLIADGYYEERPETVVSRYVGMAVAVGVIATGVGLFFAVRAGAAPTAAIVGGVGAAIPVFLFGLIMPARTEAGARKREEILGFEEFLERVESDRFRRMIRGPEQFEAYLPWAMALQVEKQWARAFEQMYSAEELRLGGWYVGQATMGLHSPTHLVSSLDSVARSTSAAMVSSPRSSSSSSGFGGGGFSGGGGGGGGGGGF